MRVKAWILDGILAAVFAFFLCQQGGWHKHHHRHKRGPQVAASQKVQVVKRSG
jgi:hypothetical protein